MRSRAAALPIVLIMALCLPQGLLLAAADGDLDSTFGMGGTLITSFGTGADIARALAIQADGRIVAAGTAGGDFALARYEPDGSLDATFGTAGRVTTDFAGGADAAFGVAIQDDGRIVVAGSAMRPETFLDLALARYEPDGTLDATFGTGGKVMTDVATGLDALHAIIILPDGAIVAAGMAFIDNAGSNLLLARYHADGSLDLSFGADGFAIADAGGTADRANALALDADGRIVVAGVASNDHDTPSDFALARYAPEGTLDPTFGANGIVITDITGGADAANGLAIQADGAILAVGSVTRRRVSLDFALVRYLPDGSLDRSFDFDGKVGIDFAGDEDRANAVQVDEDGGILVAGLAFVKRTTVALALARYLPNGRPDWRFGRAGRMTTRLARGAVANAVALLPDGHAIATGYAVSDSGTDFAMARYAFAR